MLWAAVVAGALSGVPSTLQVVARNGSPLAATRAAGTLVGRPTVVRGLVTHGIISLGWSAILARTIPRRRPVLAGAVAGGLIAVFDLGVVGRRLPAIRALPVGPQVLDHLAFGALVGAVLDRRATERSSPPSGQCGAHGAGAGMGANRRADLVAGELGDATTGSDVLSRQPFPMED